MSTQTLAYLAAALVGCITGIAELLSRYKDSPAGVFRISSAWIYIALNGAASILAFFVINVFHIQFGFSDTEPEKIILAQVICAGFGALIIIRSNLSFKSGTGEIKVGPSQALDTFLDASDRSINRIRRKRMNAMVSDIMRGISFDKARISLPSICFSLLPSVDAEGVKTFSGAVQALTTAQGMTDRAKSVALGLALAQLVGVDILYQAVDAIRTEILDDSPKRN
jgi:hypothetical protein